jgi:penicillin-binding protein 2
VIAELRNVEQELERFRVRLIVAGGFVLFCFALLASRLIHLQVLSHEELATQAENNRIAVVPIVPNRGLIVDRNGVVLADNYSAYTLEITRSQLADSLETVLDLLADHGGHRSPATVKRLKPADGRDSGASSRCPFAPSSPMTEVARFTAQRYRFPGVEIKARLFRNYPLRESLPAMCWATSAASIRPRRSSHGGVARRGLGQLPRHRGTSASWASSRSYERELHGTTGVRGGGDQCRRPRRCAA